MFPASPRRPLPTPAADQPLLVVVIDTEEEFDWARPLSRSNTGTESIADQHLAQDIFRKYGVVPTYVVDYPVATGEESARTLRALLDAGECEIGAHLHPWVNPPHLEEVTPGNSYPGNLPPELEREKLARLTEAIVESFDVRPTVYKAGRYGVGPATSGILESLGYEVDVSLVPFTSFSDDGGPDFRDRDFAPFWFGEQRPLLELPLTCGFTGALRGLGPTLFPLVSGRAGLGLRLPGLLSRLGLLERIRLSPEGETRDAHRRVTKSLLDQGCRVFSLTYHSPSLRPGMTPYVRDKRDLDQFLSSIEAYLDFFINELGGRPTTPKRLYDELAKEQALA